MRSIWVQLAGMCGGLCLAACGPSEPVKTAADTAVEFPASQALAASCSGCHSGDAAGMPSIDGYGEIAFIRSLTSYKTNPSGSTVMHRIMRGYSDQQIADIAAYLSAEGAGE